MGKPKKTIEELKKENEELRKNIKSKQDLIAIGREKSKLIRENKALKIYSKHGSAIEAGAKFGRTSAKIGKVVGKSLWNLAKRINEAEKREEIARRKAMRSPRKKSTTKKKSSSKKRRR